MFPQKSILKTNGDYEKQGFDLKKFIPNQHSIQIL